MTKPFDAWTVLPHGKLTRVTDDILTVVGDLHMPLGEFPRRMTIVRLRDTRLVIFSAIALNDDEMRYVEAYGTPAFLVVPSDLHRMDAKIWKDRYPELQVVAPEGVREKVEEIVTVDATFADFGDPNVHFVTVQGTDAHEAAITVRTDTGTTLIVNDILFNIGNRPGIAGLLFHLIGFTGDRPHIPSIVRMRAVKDKHAFVQQLEEWGHIDDLERIIVSHGDIVTRQPRKVLSELAHKLAA